MRERVEKLVGNRARAMWVMTFHSACARMLRSEAQRLGYTRGFTIYDEADSVRLVKQCVEELDVDPKRFTPRGDQAPDLGREEPAARRRGLPREGRLVLRADRRRRLRALRAADPRDERDGLRRPAVPHREPARAVPGGARALPHTFRHVLVDEYQDTNRAQYRWLQLLAEEHRNLAVVGDDDQSIYGFRGADIRNILDFEDDFPDAHVIKLEQNYRSTQTILDAANALIANNRAQKRSTSGPTRRRATRSPSASSRTSTPRRATSPARSSGTWTPAARATRSPSSTGPTRRAACSRTRSSATASATR